MCACACVTVPGIRDGARGGGCLKESENGSDGSLPVVMYCSIVSSNQ